MTTNAKNNTKHYDILFSTYTHKGVFFHEVCPASWNGWALDLIED
jgi:hypothetical protein